MSDTYQYNFSNDNYNFRYERFLIKKEELKEQKHRRNFERKIYERPVYMGKDPLRYKYWYRTMSKKEFDFLLKENQLPLLYYCGITDKKDYCKEYLGTHVSNVYPPAVYTHLVRFNLREDLNTVIQEKFMKPTGKPLEPKQEKGATSWGLGKTGRDGYYKEDCKKQNKIPGIIGHYFNDLLKIGSSTWTLISWFEYLPCSSYYYEEKYVV